MTNQTNPENDARPVHPPDEGPAGAESSGADDGVGPAGAESSQIDQAAQSSAGEEVGPSGGGEAGSSPQSDEGDGGPRMTFLEHLEELRWAIVRSLAALFGVSVAAFFAAKPLSQFLQWPLRRVGLSATVEGGGAGADFPLASLGPTDALMAALKMSFLVGVAVALPYVLWEVWRFVSPGLYNRERRLTGPFVLAGVLLFLIGVSFAFVVVLPLGLRFMWNFTEYLGVKPVWALASYLGFASTMMLAFGLAFQLPIVIIVLAKLGLVRPETLSKKRPYAVVLILVAAAFLTPPDVMTQALLAVPMMVLYEISVLAAFVVTRRRDRMAG